MLHVYDLEANTFRMLDLSRGVEVNLGSPEVSEEGGVIFEIPVYLSVGSPTATRVSFVVGIDQNVDLGTEKAAVISAVGLFLAHPNNSSTLDSRTRWLVGTRPLDQDTGLIPATRYRLVWSHASASHPQWFTLQGTPAVANPRPSR
jgi:hypothetical protein